MFLQLHSVPPTHENMLGVLSLIIYSLLRHLDQIHRHRYASGQGASGILALTALLDQDEQWPARPVLILLGIFGAALLCGTAAITPAITCSGPWRLKVATPLLRSCVMPVAVAILIGIFTIQKWGTHRVGNLFGPVMVIWFSVIALLGVRWIVRAPVVLTAVDPRHAVTFFRDNGLTGFAVLGAVFLVVTGGEALYADMGHFGKRPIRLAWFALVLPALLLNYFGQGAMLLLDSSAAQQPFFLLAPQWALLPLVGLATARHLASQALARVRSLTRGGQLNCHPRLDIDHTSSLGSDGCSVPRELGARSARSCRHRLRILERLPPPTGSLSR